MSPSVAGLIFDGDKVLQITVIDSIGARYLAGPVVEPAPNDTKNFRQAFKVYQPKRLAARRLCFDIQDFDPGQRIVKLY